MIRIVFAALVAGLLAHTCAPARAANAPLDWAMDRATTPANVCLYYTAGQCFSIGTMSSSGAWSASLAGRNIYFADDFGTFHDFIGDDAAAINAAIAAATAAGGGVVVLNPSFTYWLRDADVTIPKRVELRCAVWTPSYEFGTIPTGSQNFDNRKCAIYTKDPFHIKNNGSLRDVLVLQDRLHFLGAPVTRAELTTLINGFVGTGVEVGDGTAAGNPGGSNVENVFVAGYNLCVFANRDIRSYYSHIMGDCTNGFRSLMSLDDLKLDAIQIYPFVSTSKTNVANTWVPSAIADNGSGLYRVTTPTNDLVTGEFVTIQRGVGSQSAWGRRAITVIDSTHFDLVGSAVSPSTSATTIINNNYVTVTSTANLQVGQTVAHASLPGGTKISAVWRLRNSITVDQLATASTTNTLTATNDAFVSSPGATVHLNYRVGYGFRFDDTDGALGTRLYSSAHKFGFVLADAQGISLSGIQVEDYDFGDFDSRAISFEDFGGIASNSNLVSATHLSASAGTAIASNTAVVAGQTNTVIGPRIVAFQLANTAEINTGGQGALSLIGLFSANDAPVLFPDGARPFISASQLTFTSTFSTVYPAVFFGDGRARTFKTGNGVGVSDRIAGTSFLISATSPVQLFYAALAPADEKYWRFITSTDGRFRIETLNDASSVAAIALDCDRTGTVIDQCTFGAPVRFQTRTIAQLLAVTCNAAMKGGEAYVSDTVGAAAPTYHLAVAGAGATAIESPAYCDGAAWRYN